MLENNLADRETFFLNYLRTHPGSSKEDIVRATRGNPSRITVLKILKDMEDKKQIIARKDKPNSQIYKLYVNNNNKIASVQGELEEFKKAYLYLLQNSKDRIAKRDFSTMSKSLGISETNPSKWQNSEKKHYIAFEKEQMQQSLEDLKSPARKILDSAQRIEKFQEELDALTSKMISDGPPYIAPNNLRRVLSDYRFNVDRSISEITKMRSSWQSIRDYEISLLTKGAIILFYSMTDTMFYRSTMIWPNLAMDKETLRDLYSLVHTKIVEMQMQLSEFLRSNKIILITDPVGYIIRNRDMVTEENLSSFVLCYSLLEMRSEIKPVLDSIVKLNKEIEDCGYPNFYSNISKISFAIFEAEKILSKVKELLKKSKFGLIKGSLT
jgi:hypothetical protein